jgi:capsular polysaccharide transport system permease protein
MWTIFEPLAHILVMVSLISLFAHSRPPIGDHFAVFYFTGIIPYTLFLHTAGQMMSAVRANRPLLQLPPVHTHDVYFSRAMLEITTTLVVSGIFIVGFLALGLKALPINPVGVLAALLILWATAVGIGILNAIIASFFDGWERIWGAITSLVYFSSGTFYIPRIMPEHIRDVLAWSPVLQAIEMVRVNYFYEPYPAWLDIKYMCILALTTLTLGLVLERIYRRRLLEIE